MKKIISFIMALLMLAPSAFPSYSLTEHLPDRNITDIAVTEPSVSRREDAVSEVGITGEEDAAVRLYCMGFASADTDEDGDAEFHLDRELTRLEAAVLAVRLMGAESAVSASPQSFSHGYTDVPEWASAYIGYLASSDALGMPDGELFMPEKIVALDSVAEFLLSLLGYTPADHGGIPAARFAFSLGIVDAISGTATRGEAFKAVLLTLRSRMNGSDVTLAEKLVMDGVIDYNDAVFLVWSENSDETDSYIRAMGYSFHSALPNGYYTLALPLPKPEEDDGKEDNGDGEEGSDGEDSDGDGQVSEGGEDEEPEPEPIPEYAINVLVDGANTDYEGVGVTLCERTDDISQKFRLEQTPRNTYMIYAACSRGGYNRVLGINPYTDSLALFSETSPYACEFYVIDDGEGSYVLLSSDGKRSLELKGDAKTGGELTLAPTDGTNTQRWTLEPVGKKTEDGEEYALYPSNTLFITQGAYDDFSHQTQNAIDFITYNGRAFAPFTGVIRRIETSFASCNAVWFESSSKVLYADGRLDYMTVIFMHDNYVYDLYVGQVVTQGEYFYDMGTAGNSAGSHIHVACIAGRYDPYEYLTGSGTVLPEDALHLLPETVIYDDYGLDWKYAP